MRKKLTKKQAALVKARVANPDATLVQLKDKAKYCDTQTVSDTLRKPVVKARIQELMDANPALTDEALTKKLAQKLEAKETKFFAHQGQVIDTEEVEAHGIQMQALDLALKVKGHLTSKVDLTSDGKSIVALLMDEEV